MRTTHNKSLDVRQKQPFFKNLDVEFWLVCHWFLPTSTPPLGGFSVLKVALNGKDELSNF